MIENHLIYPYNTSHEFTKERSNFIYGYAYNECESFRVAY